MLEVSIGTEGQTDAICGYRRRGEQAHIARKEGNQGEKPGDFAHQKNGRNRREGNEKDGSQKARDVYKRQLYLYVKDKKPFCAAVFVLGVLVKPQMLMFGPLLAVAYIKDIVHAPKKGLRELALSICFGIGTLVLVALPFTLKQNPLWLWEKYTSAAGLYPYATVNAFNLYALLGMNWAADTTPVLFGLSAKGFGTMMIVAVCVLDVYKRQVVSDSRTPRDGRFIEEIGFYNPLTDPGEIQINAERAQYWLGNGAQPSDTVRALLKKSGVTQ